MMNICMKYQDWTCCGSCTKETQWNRCSAKWHIPPVINRASVHLGWGGAQQLQRVRNYYSSHFGHVDQADSLNRWILDPQNADTRATCGTLALWWLLGVKQCRTEAKVYADPMFFAQDYSSVSTSNVLMFAKALWGCEMLHLSASWW